MSIKIMTDEIRDSLREVFFMSNDDYLRTLVISKINKIIDFYVAQGDIYEYIVVCDNTNNREEDKIESRLYIDIMFKELSYSQLTKMSISFNGDEKQILRKERKEKLEKLKECLDQ